MKDVDWNHRTIETARSAGGVVALRNPWEGLVRGDVSPWPTPELIQKCYQSRQVRAFSDDELETVIAHHGFYSDLQSVHSEDAVTWSLFGPMSYASPAIRAAFVASVATECLGSEQSMIDAHVWLWRRLPHPDSLVPGGPEIDFGLQTKETLILGEAKWRSGVGKSQGVGGKKDQLQLRVEFCKKYGAALFPNVKQFVVLFVSQKAGTLTETQIALASDRIHVVDATWDQLGNLPTNPWRAEFMAHLKWRQTRSLAS